MRIALVGHVRHPVAPPFMGGMEAHSWHLARALAERGHDVTLFASGDSTGGAPPGVTVHPVLDDHYDRTFPWHDFHGTDALNTHVDAAFADAAGALLAGGFDVIHNNSLHRYPPRLSRAHRLPMVTSLHVPPFGALRRSVHVSAAPWTLFTVTSDRQRAAWWPDGAPSAAHVVHNGIDLSLWPFQDRGDGSAVWAGRITPNKGTHLAVQAARAAEVPLTVFGTIEHRDYFDDAVAPHLGGDIRYGGHLPGDDLARALGQASVLLFTPLWDEPFGLAAIEAMATGLPVAAIDLGAVREVIGPAGTYAPPDDVPALAMALKAAMAIPRPVARARVEALFTLDRMVDRYEALYDTAIRGTAAGLPHVTFPEIELRIAQLRAFAPPRTSPGDARTAPGSLATP